MPEEVESCEQSKAPDSLHTEMYRQASESKRHYDLLSWSTTGAAIAIVGFLAKSVAENPIDSVAIRVLVGAFTTIVLLACWQIYERNRIWAHTASGAAKSIESRFKGSLGYTGVELSNEITYNKLQQERSPGRYSRISITAGVRLLYLGLLLLLIFSLCPWRKTDLGPVAPAQVRAK